jgi:type II secretory ATPase GspE/PulE/Tfp pilus assembly ATPase PilB-like protein
MADFTIDIHGRANVLKVDLDATPVTIGRHASNRVVLDDVLASRAHAVIEQVKGGVQLRDLNSSNGTFLNGQKVRSTLALKPGDQITIGSTRLILQGNEPPPNEFEEEFDELGEEDVVHEPVIVRDSDKISIGGYEGDYEEALDELVGNLPDGGFEEHEIALVGAKGRVSHEAAHTARKQGSRRDMSELYKLVLLAAFRSHATDIHLEPRKDGYHLRMRCDGVLIDAARFPMQVGVKFAAMSKVIGDVDIAQRDSIQEGNFSSRVPSDKDPNGFRRVDYRLSFAPTTFGQKLVIRVLDTENSPLKLQDLNLPNWMARQIAEAIAQDAGMVLVAGPTGSGKTTTLYSLLRSIDYSQRNVMTIEDPVEIQLDGITQIPVDEAHGKSFAAILRSALRQDPDVILVGEIRDAETARTAMQAAITGHLVFSTVHTKDTAGTIFRLMDLGVEPYMIGQGLHMVIAQRLVRNLCATCRKPVAITPEQLKMLGPKYANLKRLYEPVGCKKCLGTGYFGRRAVFELLTSTEKLRDVILSSPTIKGIHEAMAETQFVRLIDTGYDLAAKGIVSMQEVERAVGK